MGITVVLLLTMSHFSLGCLRGANPSVAQFGMVKIVSTGCGRGVVEEKVEGGGLQAGASFAVPASPFLWRPTETSSR